MNAPLRLTLRPWIDRPNNSPRGGLARGCLWADGESRCIPGFARAAGRSVVAAGPERSAGRRPAPNRRGSPLDFDGPSPAQDRPRLLLFP